MTIKAYGDPSSLYEAVTAANTITAGESGKTFGHASAAAIVHTLPAAAKGLNFKFVVTVAPTANSTIVTNSSANVIHGQVGTSEDAAGDVACAASSDTITLVASKAIIGDWVKVECHDGTNWIVSGMCDVQDAITTTQAS